MRPILVMSRPAIIFGIFLARAAVNSKFVILTAVQSVFERSSGGNWQRTAQLSAHFRFPAEPRQVERQPITDIHGASHAVTPQGKPHFDARFGLAVLSPCRAFACCGIPAAEFPKFPVT